MDIPTLLEAFKILHERGESACLFFLTRSNPSMVRSQDTPAQTAWKLARELQIEGVNVFFNEKKATPNDLPGYLEHCRSGILSNPERLESIGSWRTRLLDLLWSGRPAVVSGWDPLAQQMIDAKCAYIVESGNPADLASAISEMTAASNSDYDMMCFNSFSLGQKYLWEKNLAAYQNWLSSHLPLLGRRKAHLLTLLRSLIGF
jgi:glycosyltransferase involved in cell wall biosynthesis